MIMSTRAGIVKMAKLYGWFCLDEALFTEFRRNGDWFRVNWTTSGTIRNATNNARIPGGTCTYAESGKYQTVMDYLEPAE